MRLPTWTTQLYKPLVPHSNFSRNFRVQTVHLDNYQSFFFHVRKRKPGKKAFGKCVYPPGQRNCINHLFPTLTSRVIFPYKPCILIIIEVFSRKEKKTGKEHVRKMRLPTWTTQLYKPLVPHINFSRNFRVQTVHLDNYRSFFT